MFITRRLSPKKAFVKNLGHPGLKFWVFPHRNIIWVIKTDDSSHKAVGMKDGLDQGMDSHPERIERVYTSLVWETQFVVVVKNL